MTDAEKRLAELEEKAANRSTSQSSPNRSTSQSSPNSSKKRNVDQKGIESSLAIVAETQYQNGVALTRMVGEQSFLKGINDELEAMIEVGDIDDDQLNAIAAKFQDKASKRLADRSPLILPPSFWLLDTQVEEVTDGNNS
jgi:uncharacterized coiled-coil protein SlyX